MFSGGAADIMQAAIMTQMQHKLKAAVFKLTFKVQSLLKNHVIVTW